MVEFDEKASISLFFTHLARGDFSNCRTKVPSLNGHNCLHTLPSIIN
jgi:hypothetical protein